MIELTVMTMDSKSRKFKVSDMLTILEFKEHIADQVKIKAVDQRLIFLGRVLDNQTKLADIAVDIDGKVFHLVHKVPRLATTTTGSTSSTSTNTISRSRRPLRENLWRVTHLDDNIRLPTGRLNSGNLLNSMIHDTEDKLKIAMNMIQRSNEILNGLEHARITKDLKQIPEELQQTEDRSGNVPKSSRQPVQSDSYSETVSDEVDETFPNNVASGASRPILFSAFLCDYAMRHRSRLNIGESSRNSTEQFSDTNVPTLSTNPSLTEQATGLLPPSAATEQNSRNDCLNSETRSSALSNNRHNLKKLIDQLNRLNIRLEPFLAQYCQYINEDPQFESIEGGNGSNRAQAIFNGVSEVMHFISHVYHAISDFNFFLNRPPPRFLQLNSSDSIPHNYLTNYTSAILPPSSTQRHVSTQTTSTNQSTYVPGVDSPNLRVESPNVPNVSTSTEKNSDISDDSNIELNDTIDIPLHIEIMNEPVGFGSNETFVNPIETSQDTAVPQPSSGNETSNFDANLDNCVERTHSIGLEPIPFPDDSNSVPPTSTCTHCETSETTNSSSTTNLPPQDFPHGCIEDPFLPCSSHHLNSLNRGFRHLSQITGRSTLSVNRRNLITVFPGGQNPERQFNQHSTMRRENHFNNTATTPASNITAITLPNTNNTFFMNNRVFNMEIIQQIIRDSNRHIDHAMDFAYEYTMIYEPVGTVSQFKDYEGQSILIDLFLLIARNWTLHDVIFLRTVQSTIENHPISENAEAIMNFVLERIMQNQPSNMSNIEEAANRIYLDMVPYIGFFEHFAPRPQRNIGEHLLQCITRHLHIIVNICKNRFTGVLDQDLASRELVSSLKTFATEICKLIIIFCENCIVFNLSMFAMMQSLPRQLFNAIESLLDFEFDYEINFNLYWVRGLQLLNSSSTEYYAPSINQESGQTSTVITQENTETSNNPASPSSGIVDEPLPEVVMGFQECHQSVSLDNLSGMPKKMAENSKPQGPLSQTTTRISEVTMTETGLDVKEEVTESAAADIEAQSASTERIRTSGSSGLNGRPDCCPNRHSDAS